MAVHITIDESMVSRDRYIINYAYITVLATTYFDSILAWGVTLRYEFFRVNDMKHFLVTVAETFKNYEVFLRLLNADNIHDLVFVRNLER